MKFQPLTEEEIKRAMFIEDGSYNYKVVKSSEKKSDKTGNDYIALELTVWDKAGKERLIFCNLWSIKLLKHFCDVNGMEEDYKSGDIPSYKFMNKSGGKVTIGFEPEKINPTGGMYKAKNVILDFVSDSAMPNNTHKNDIDDLLNQFDKDVPF